MDVPNLKTGESSIVLHPKSVHGHRPLPVGSPCSRSLSSSAIFVRVRGRQATGRVRVELDETTVSDYITVDITPRGEAPRGTSMCLMEKEKGELGVEIFVSDNLSLPVTYSPLAKRRQTTGVGWTVGQISRSQSGSPTDRPPRSSSFPGSKFAHPTSKSPFRT
jgi:hypothetical protein